MKYLLRIFLIAFTTFSIPGNTFSQSAPLWTATINILPDSAYLFPVKVLTDGSNNIYVLSTYSKSISTGTNINRIYLHKYDMAGSLLWNIVFDSLAAGAPRGFDMAIDINNNCYVAGGYMSAPNFLPLLLKVNSAGTIVWTLNTISSFNYGYFNQAILNDSVIYLQSTSGIAAVDLNGVEQWSLSMIANLIAVDEIGQLIVAGSMVGSNDNIFRFSSPGILNLSDSTIYANKITTDFDCSIYLLTDVSSYELVKLDSSGAFQWSYNNFPPPPPFGDISLEVLVDNNNDVLVAGVDDSLYKFSSSGTRMWTSSLNGLGSYRVSAKIGFSNVVVIAGTFQDTSQSDIGVATFDLNGNQNWLGSYNSNSTQEFVVDLAINNSGIYVLEDSISNPTLIKFESPFSTFIDYNLICVDSVWYDIANPDFINVTVFNGNNSHLNYPSVQIVSPTGDTIGNHNNLVNFFAHLGNQFQTYTDSITILGITDFSNYTFLISEGFGTTTAEIGFCSTTGIHSVLNQKIVLYPNPVYDYLNLVGPLPNEKFVIEIFDLNSKLILTKNLQGPSKINIERLANGLYFLRILQSGGISNFRLVKR